MTAIIAAKAFLKKHFCIVGMSPESLTNSVISEKKNESAITRLIPIACLCLVVNSFSFIEVHYTILVKSAIINFYKKAKKTAP